MVVVGNRIMILDSIHIFSPQRRPARQLLSQNEWHPGAWDVGDTLPPFLRQPIKRLGTPLFFFFFLGFTTNKRGCGRTGKNPAKKKRFLCYSSFFSITTGG